METPTAQFPDGGLAHQNQARIANDGGAPATAVANPLQHEARQPTQAAQTIEAPGEEATLAELIGNQLGDVDSYLAQKMRQYEDTSELDPHEAMG